MKLAANLFAALLALLAASTASAQSNYPNRPVKILVGFMPGTAPDLAARILADRFSEVWGTPFVVENIPGAGSNIATDRVAKAAADGYSLLMGGNSSLVINPSLYETLPFDPLRDFAPISQVFIAANVLAVPPELPVKTVAELVALAKAQPGQLSYGHAGVGTSQHLGAELFKYMAQVDIAAVPYRGTTALMPDLLAGRITMSFANIVNVVPLAREGKLRAGARAADHGGIRLPRLRGRAVVRPAGADRHAKGCSGSTAGRDRQGAGDAGGPQEVRRTRPRAGRQYAGRVYRRHPEGNAGVGKPDQAGRHQARQLARPGAHSRKIDDVAICRAARPRQDRLRQDCSWRKAAVPVPMLRGNGLEQGYTSASCRPHSVISIFGLAPKYHSLLVAPGLR
jgi:tripartite-type tricarboxylate transporter receptor subunit TctC